MSSEFEPSGISNCFYRWQESSQQLPFCLFPPSFLPDRQLLWRNALSVHGQVKLLSLLQQRVGACRGLERCVSSKIFYWSLHISCRLQCRSCRFHCRRSSWQGKGFTSGCRRHTDQEEFMNGLRTAWSPWAKCLQCVFISESELSSHYYNSPLCGANATGSLLSQFHGKL